MVLSTMRPVVAFVVRASIQDGLGHLVRSLSVLREMQGFARPHLFVLGDKSGSHLIEESGIAWVECADDGACVRNVLELNPQVVVFDTLHFNQLNFDCVATQAITISLSPVFSCMGSVDHLFHRTVTEAPEWGTAENFPKLHKGLKYTVLPSWLRRISTKHYREMLNESKLSIAISMGGADAPNRTLTILQELGRHPEKLVIWVALGDAYTHSYEDLLRCAKENRQEIILLKSNESMWRVLRNVSLVICAGGLTTYEAAYVGVPSINILQSANWIYLFSELAAKNICFVLPPSDDSIFRVSQLVSSLSKERGGLLRMHESSKHVVPDGGAQRIARKIIKLAANGY